MELERACFGYTCVLEYGVHDVACVMEYGVHDASFRVYCNNGGSMVCLHTFLFTTSTVGGLGYGYLLVYYNHGGWEQIMPWETSE